MEFSIHSQLAVMQIVLDMCDAVVGVGDWQAYCATRSLCLPHGDLALTAVVGMHLWPASRCQPGTGGCLHDCTELKDLVVDSQADGSLLR